MLSKITLKLSLLMVFVCVSPASASGIEQIKQEYPELCQFLDSSEFKSALGDWQIEIIETENGSHHARVRIEISDFKLHRALQLSKSIINRTVLTADELKFIVCHELGHRNDRWLLARILIPASIWYAGLLLSIRHCFHEVLAGKTIMPKALKIAAVLCAGYCVKQYIKRSGEYYADQYGLELTGDLAGAIAALEKRRQLWPTEQSENPFIRTIKQLFADHSTEDERIAQLKRSTINRMMDI